MPDLLVRWFTISAPQCTCLHAPLGAHATLHLLLSPISCPSQKEHPESRTMTALLLNTSHQGDMLSVNNWHKTKGLAMDDNNIVAIRDLEIQIFLKKIPKFHG